MYMYISSTYISISEQALKQTLICTKEKRPRLEFYGTYISSAAHGIVCYLYVLRRYKASALDGGFTYNLFVKSSSLMVKVRNVNCMYVCNVMIMSHSALLRTLTENILSLSLSLRVYIRTVCVLCSQQGIFFQKRAFALNTNSVALYKSS